MSRTVWKYRLVGGDDTVVVPGRVVHVGVDVAERDGWPTAWVEVEHGNLTYSTVAVFGTGADVPDGWTYAGTALDHGRGLVWHAYVREGVPHDAGR